MHSYNQKHNNSGRSHSGSPKIHVPHGMKLVYATGVKDEFIGNQFYTENCVRSQIPNIGQLVTWYNYTGPAPGEGRDDMLFTVPVTFVTPSQFVMDTFRGKGRVFQVVDHIPYGERKKRGMTKN